MQKSKATNLRSLTYVASSGLLPDLDDINLKALARSVFNYEKKTMQEIKVFLKEIGG